MTNITINLSVDLDSNSINSNMFVDGEDVGLFEQTSVTEGVLGALIIHFEKLKIRVAQAVPSEQFKLEQNPKLAPASAMPAQLDAPAEIIQP